MNGEPKVEVLTVSPDKEYLNGLVSGGYDRALMGVKTGEEFDDRKIAWLGVVGQIPDEEATKLADYVRSRVETDQDGNPNDRQAREFLRDFLNAEVDVFKTGESKSLGVADFISGLRVTAG